MIITKFFRLLFEIIKLVNIKESHQFVKKQKCAANYEKKILN